MEERTGWRGQNESQTGGEEKRNDRLYGAAKTNKERAEWRRLQWKKEQSRQSKVSDDEGERVKVGESRTLAKESRIRARAWSGKGGLHGERGQIPKRKESARRASLEQIEGSMSG